MAADEPRAQHAEDPAAETDPLAGFEASMEELERLVERMEQGQQSLEAALQDFERGIHLTRRCQQALTQAQQKVDVLMEQREDAGTEPFEGTGENGSSDGTDS